MFQVELTRACVEFATLQAIVMARAATLDGMVLARCIQEYFEAELKRVEAEIQRLTEELRFLDEFPTPE